MARKHIIHKQRQRRQTQEVKRVEFVLDSSIEAHHTIFDHLDALPRGDAADFIRQAILEKIARETSPAEPEPQTTSASAEFNMILAKLAFLERIMQNQQQPASVAATVPDRPPTLPEAPGSMVSSGIDMSRPRPRPAARPAPRTLPEEPLPELTEAESIRLAKIMAASIRRANPGRG